MAGVLCSVQPTVGAQIFAQCDLVIRDPLIQEQNKSTTRPNFNAVLILNFSCPVRFQICLASFGMQYTSVRA